MAGPQGKKEDKIVRKTFLFRRQIITFVMILQTNMKALLLVGAGGFAGSALRYLISRLMLPWAVSSGFPFSTLTVNVAGSLLIGAVIAAIIADDVDPEAYVEEHGMKQTTDTGAIEQLVEQLMQENPDKVAAYRDGKKGLQGFFMGQIMKAMKGQGNPKVISKIVTDKLEG